MAAFRPEIFTIDEVINFYDAAEGSEYKIFAGVNPTPQYLRYNFVGEKEIGRQELVNALTQLRNNIENYNPYLIQVISEGNTARGKKKENPILTSISFQLNRPQSMMPMQAMAGMGSPRTEMLLEKLVEQNAMLQSRIAAIEAMDDLEEEEEAPKSPIDQMLSNPQLQEALIAGVMSMVSGMLTKGAPTAIAGIGDETEAVEILRSLMNKGVTIDHLRKLDQMSSSKLSSLLFML
jgi:energy-coupling factor transporter ATP-binding protein EcfA2